MIPSDHPAKIRALIVDDEPLARSNIAVLLRMDPEIGIVGECGSGTEAIGEIRISKPDLLFLDVQMPECDGFDVLELIGKDLPTAIVFVTAYDQYALRAFEAGALDYLLKPFDNARFELALGRAKQRIRHDDQSEKRWGREILSRESWSASSSRALAKFRSSISRTSTGSKPQTTTPACTSAPGAIFCGGVSRIWKRIWIPPFFAACTGRAS